VTGFPELQALYRALDRSAKAWWSSSLTLKFCGFAVGILAILPVPQEPVPFLVAGFALLSELCGYRADSVKSSAQALRRALDVYDSFGWEPSAADLSDLFVRNPGSFKTPTSADMEAYFASAEPPGTTRALQNLSESAWWTKHLAESMALICTVILVLAALSAFSILIAVVQTTQSHGVQVNVARIVTAFLMFLLSLGIVKLILGYRGLAARASKCEIASLRLQQLPSNELDAFRALYDYHIGRAVGPLIPTWIWKWRKRELRQAWAQFRMRKT